MGIILTIGILGMAGGAGFLLFHAQELAQERYLLSLEHEKQMAGDHKLVQKAQGWVKIQG
jgi:hypothetical protein